MRPILNETLKSLNEAATLEGVHVSTLHRWRLKGVRGVKLETCRRGGSRCTSLQALQRFHDEITRRTDGETYFLSEEDADVLAATQKAIKKLPTTRNLKT